MFKSLSLLIPVFLLTACGRDEIETYQVPKEEAQAPAVQLSAPVQQAPAQPAASSGSSLGFTAETPDSWTEKAGSGMRIVSYSIEGTGIDFYLISLAMGDVPSNVNRWRGQVGLTPAASEEIAADVQTFQADGHDVSYIEIYNEEGGNGIIAAIIDFSPKYWYFTAKGSVEELKAHAGEIRTFLETLNVQ